MKTVTDTLGLARSSIAERVKGTRPKRGPQTRDGDLELTAAIRPSSTRGQPMGTGGSPRSSGASGDPTVWPRSTPSASTG
jgi:hypothetical protein